MNTSSLQLTLFQYTSISPQVISDAAFAADRLVVAMEDNLEQLKAEHDRLNLEQLKAEDDRSNQLHSKSHGGYGRDKSCMSDASSCTVDPLIVARGAAASAAAEEQQPKLDSALKQLRHNKSPLRNLSTAARDLSTMIALAHIERAFYVFLTSVRCLISALKPEVVTEAQRLVDLRQQTDDIMKGEAHIDKKDFSLAAPLVASYRRLQSFSVILSRALR